MQSDIVVFRRKAQKVKKWIALLVFVVFCVSASAFVYSNLLDHDDLEFQIKDNENGVAVGSGLLNEDPWESYNQWQCFELEKTKFDCAEYDYGKLVPSIRVESKEGIRLFDTHVEDKLNCLQTLTVWRNLVNGGREICIFAAQMPDVDLGTDQDKPQSLWYITKLKGVGGYWILTD
jgi:hypothetical protein